MVSSVMPYPIAIQHQLTKKLKRLAQLLIKNDKEQIRLDADNNEDDDNDLYYLAQAAVIAYLASAFDQIKELVLNFLTDDARRNYGIPNLVLESPEQLASYNQWIAITQDLIDSVPTDFNNRVKKVRDYAKLNGLNRTETKKLLQKEYDRVLKRVELIAKDQTEKMSGLVSKDLQEWFGLNSYRWRGVLDNRERPHHVAREGLTFSWSKPPFDGHPSMPINCRCWAEPSWGKLTTLRNWHLMNNKGKL